MAGAGGALSRSRRGVPAARRRAGAQRRHDRRQHRQRLADRRQPAGADRARRARSCCAAAASGASCRSRTSSSTTASRTGSRPSSSRRSCVPQARARPARFAPTRSPSASIRTSRRCCAALRAAARRAARSRPCGSPIGGMAATPKRARRMPRRRCSASLDRGERSSAAMAALPRDFTPLTDMRASAGYRATGGGEPAATLVHRDAPTPEAETRLVGDRRPGPCLSPRSPNASAAASHAAAPHDSAHLHVSRRGRLHRRHARAARACCTSTSASAPARTRASGASTSSRVRAAPGVVLVLTAADIPGANDVSPTHRHDEPMFADDAGRVRRPAAVRGGRRDPRRGAARRPARRWSSTRTCRPVLDVEARAEEPARSCCQPMTLQRGDAAGRASPRRRTGSRASSRSAARSTSTSRARSRYAIPGEDGDMLVHSSTQHPTEVQHMVAHVLGLPNNAVTVECRRMGGGFGGKETQRPCSPASPRSSRKQTGRAGQAAARPRRRHGDHRQAPLLRRTTTRSASTTTAASTASRSTDAAPLRLLGRPVRAGDRPRAVPHRQRLLPARRRASLAAAARPTRSRNTAFRGFGGPQGMIAIERVIDDDRAARSASDPLDVRKRNFYGIERAQRHALPADGRGQHHRTSSSTSWRRSADYRARRAGDRARSTRRARCIKRGIALTPVKFGISFTVDALQPGRRAGARLHRRQRAREPRRHRDGPGPATPRWRRSWPTSSRSTVEQRAHHAPPTPARCPTPRPPRRRPAPT